MEPAGARPHVLTVGDSASVTELPPLHRPPVPSGRRALVSICITTFNQSGYIDGALRSALGQTYDPLEIVVVDDASTDDTVQRVRSYGDPRVRLFVNERNVGQSANRNRALAFVRGDLIKFLDADDFLQPDCVTKMARLAVGDPAIGLIFSRRRIALDGPPQAGQAWVDRFGDLHTRFQAIQPINDGRALLEEWLSAGLGDNWIGEPSAVMVRRAHLEVSGGFAHHVRLAVDADLWARLLPRARVGFLDEELVTYRWSEESETSAAAKSRRNWLDHLWTLEALHLDPELRRAYPQIDGLLGTERRQAHRSVMRLGYIDSDRRVPLPPYLPYVRFRMLSAAGRHPELFPRLSRAAEA